MFGWDGTERRHFLLGDAIESVQVTREGHIWVSYFDEGVYGGLTWGAESDPPAAAGLLTTDPYGRILWRYRAPAGIGRIDDCYALNVGRREAWAYYYSDFPLVRIDSEGVVTAWTTEIAGARAFAVTNDCVLFCGGYRDRRWDTVLWKLGEGVLEDPREVHLVMPRGVRPERDATYVGRGSMLTVFDGPRWYQVDLRDLPS